MRLFQDAFKPNSTTTILDVGGYPATWRDLSARPQITVLNIHEIDYVRNPSDPPIQTVVGNGCRLEFDAHSFDIVFSNSVIEHVGTFENKQMFADECRRVGGRLWVQTPARSFFIEPHLLTPFIHFLPLVAQRALIRNFTVWGLLTRPSGQDVRDLMAEIRLLTRKEMQVLFPDCTIIAEKVLGLTKSYVAIR